MKFTLRVNGRAMVTMKIEHRFGPDDVAQALCAFAYGHRPKLTLASAAAGLEVTPGRPMTRAAVEDVVRVALWSAGNDGAWGGLEGCAWDEDLFPGDAVEFMDWAVGEVARLYPEAAADAGLTALAQRYRDNAKEGTK